MKTDTQKSKAPRDEIRPSGTVKQGRRPMFKPFDNNDDTCPKCGSSTCTHIWELEQAPPPQQGERVGFAISKRNHRKLAPAKPNGEHSPLPWTWESLGLVISRNGEIVVARTNGNEANAKLIVASVNHADKLATALRAAIGRLERLLDDASGEHSPAYKQARAALAAWKEANER